MAQVLKSISVSLFALLILAVSSGFYINKHYCAGDLQYVAINQEAPSCHELDHLPPEEMTCHEPAENTCHQDAEEECCQDEYQTFKTDHYTFPHASVIFNVQAFTAVLPVIDLLFENSLTNQNLPFHLAEPPPPITADFQVRFQSFLL